MENIAALLQKIKVASFPKLSNTEIHLAFVSHKSFIAATRLSTPFKPYEIRLNLDDVKKMGEFELTGVLAHELVHIDEWNKLFFIQKIFHLYQSKDEKFVTKDERDTDLKVIGLGYGQQLLAFQQYHDKYYKAYKSGDGLTKKEIREILKAFK